jgi:hypothetical protein
MQQFKIDEARVELSDLAPIEPQQSVRQPGSGKGQLLYMAEDFDATPDDFTVYC